jgi:signal transduction histidine kinase
VTATTPTTAGRLPGWVAGLRANSRQPRFWIVQALVLALSGLHFALEAFEQWTPSPGLYLLPITTLFIPVVYAALNFGVEGALPTGLLCVALSMPNVFLFHDGPQRVGVLTQLALLLVLGVMVAARVDREQRAKENAETANRGLQAAQDTLRSYVQLAMRAQESERQRLSRELHDETIQELLVVRNSLRDPAQPGQTIEQRISRIESSLDNSIDGIRRLCRALRPSILDDLGLLPAIEALTGEIRDRSHLDVPMMVSGTPVRLPDEAELAVYRVVQEALRNVQRHSSATRVTVELAYGADGTTASVLDNGRGFDPSRPVAADRLGLVGMRERARLVGGDVTMARADGLTRVTFRLPTPPEALLKGSRVEGTTTTV